LSIRRSDCHDRRLHEVQKKHKTKSSQKARAPRNLPQARGKGVSALGFLTVGQTARILGVSASALRQWENIGLITPARSQGRFRLYSPEVLDVLKRIKYLRDVKQLRGPGLKHLLDKPASSARKAPERASSQLGLKLRRLRKRCKLSLVDAARRAKISAGFLSAVELSQANPSVATLQRLAATYDSTVLDFYDLPQQSSRLIRPNKRRVLRTESGVAMELLSEGSRMLQSMLFRLPPGSGSDGAYSHAGEEFICMLKGSLEIWLDELERNVLHEGDAFWFESNRGHRWFNPSRDQEAVLLWVNTPPTF
jgi:DNA-binding transcriptional MerR regulator/quercetin dioxygenase-like cupin family protein